MANCTANSIYNKNSNKRVGEKELINANKRVIYRLNEKYYDFLREHNMIVCSMPLKYKDWTRFVRKITNNPNLTYAFDLDRGFKPDGDFICLYDKVKDISYVLAASEAKEQGTNKGRIKAGENKQAIGNAIERSSKNLGLMNLFFSKLPFNPYAIFMSGCDFNSKNNTKYMRNKVLEINLGYPLNKVLLNQGMGYTGCSIFCREKKYSISEMEEVLYQIAENSLKYYMDTYFKDETCNM